VPGSLTFFQGQVGYLKARGVNVWALSSPGELLDQFAARERVPVHGLAMRRRITPLGDLATTARLWRWLRKVRPDIVNAHTPKGGLLGMVGRGWRACRYGSTTMHGLPPMTATGLKRRLLRWAEKVSCLLAHQVFCVSASLREAAVAEGLCQPDKITVLHHGSINGVAAETATRRLPGPLVGFAAQIGRAVPRFPLTPSRIAALTSRARYPMTRLTEAGFQLSRSLLEDAEAVGAACRT
jgi:hypothetical protein